MKSLYLLSLLTIITAVNADIEPSPLKRAQRRANALVLRNAVGKLASDQNLQKQENNGDEARYDNKRGTFGKTLPHSDEGFVDTKALAKLVEAIKSGVANDFNKIPMGTSPVQRKLVNPQAAFAYNLDGADSWLNSMPAAPTLASTTTAAEMIELYWHALLRDVSFNDYGTDATAAMAITELSGLPAYQGPRVGGAVTAGSLFRGTFAGDLAGPYVSQFLYQPVPVGPLSNFDDPLLDYQQQVVPTSSTANDFMTSFANWLPIQRGINPENQTDPTQRTITYTPSHSFIRNGRDLGDYVHQDVPQQTYHNAALILLYYGADALDRNNPYISNPTQESFVNYGMPDIIYLVSVATEVALRTAWYQKWVVQRRARPEFLGFLAEQQVTTGSDLGLDASLINSTALAMTSAAFGTSFLPQAYPEGSPAHPSYPAGHATVAGACATILKAFFNEDFEIPKAIQPNAANTAMELYTDTALTVGGEINKLASNMSIGRNTAGVHYRSDGLEGMLLGEKVAIAILENEAFTRNMPFSGFSLTKFDGTKILVGARQEVPMLP